MGKARHLFTVICVTVALVAILAPAPAFAATASVSGVRVIDVATGSAPTTTLTADGGRTLLVDDDATLTISFDLLDETGAAESDSTCRVRIAGIADPIGATYTALPSGESRYVLSLAPGIERDVSLADDLVFLIDDGTGETAVDTFSLDAGGVRRVRFTDGDAAATLVLDDSSGHALALTEQNDSVLTDAIVYPRVDASFVDGIDDGFLMGQVDVTATDDAGSSSSSSIAVETDGGSLRATDAVDLGTAGTYSVDLSYLYDLSGYYGFSACPAQRLTYAHTLVVDLAAPSAATIVGLPDASATYVWSDALVNAGRTLLFTIADDASGVVTDEVSVGYTMCDYHGRSLGSGTAQATWDGTSFAVSLPADAIIDLADLEVSAHDRAGREIASSRLTPIPFTTHAGDSFTRMVTTTAGVVVGDLVSFEPDSSTNEWVSVGVDATMGSTADDELLLVSNATAIPTVRMRVADVLLPYLGWDPYAADGDVARISSAFGATLATTDMASPTSLAAFVNTDTTYDTGSRSFVTPYALPDEGLYELSLTYRGETYVSHYVVDGTAPTVQGAQLLTTDDDMTATYEDGHEELVGRTRTIEITVSDLLGGTQERQSDAEGRPTTAGTASVTVVLPHKADPSQGKWDKTPMTIEAEREGSGDTWTLTLTEPGVYDLANAAVVATDRAGNTVPEGSIVLGNLLSEGGSNVTLIHVVPDEQVVPVVKVSGTQASHPGYYNGAITVSVSIDDPWIGVYRNVSGYIDGEVVYNVTVGGKPYTGKLQTLSLSKLADKDGDGVWTAKYKLFDPESKDKPPLPVEGTYTMYAEYYCLGGKSSSKATPVIFVADHTAPSLGVLTASVTAPEHWGYVFVDGIEILSLGVSDKISGIDAASVVATLAGPTARQQPPVYDEARSSLRMTLAGDAQRLYLEGTSLGVSDLAGNPSPAPSFSALQRLGRTNLPDGTAGIVIDTQTPTLSVSYDNTDVRNGGYYNAQRVATFTLVESNFDLVKANDGGRTIVSVTVDGQTRPIAASDFENPSGDGVTWVAQETLAADGDWVIDGSFVDPAGHASNVIHDEFTIDTTAPLLVVDFDNNDARNGSYYNSPRTATVTLVERNPTGAYAIVSTKANDASGAAVEAPGHTAWARTDEQYGWSCSVHFGDELHYALTASAVDLAGNEAAVVEVPEFVVDMTAPSLLIERVDDRTAYAGEVAPRVSMSDDNYDLSASTHALTGAHSGEVDYLPGMDVDYQDTGVTVAYADFEHTLERDDVYTLSAHAEDLAGNSVEESKTFSVNRFGSNYLYADDTARLRGSYVKTARDVVVTEINVSGLKDDETVVELVRNSEVETLVEGRDYIIEKGDDAGWSATTYTVPATTFAGDAYYRLILTSRDLAGNLSQNTMEDKDADRSGVASVAFAIDGSVPAVGFAGVTSYGLYFGPDRDALPIVGDNLELQGVTVQLDDDEPVDFTAEQVDAGELSCMVPSDAQYHTVTVTATDRAGNATTSVAANVMVAADWGAFLSANPRILFAVVAVALLTAGALVAALVLAVRHYRRGEASRNPFGH